MMQQSSSPSHRGYDAGHCWYYVLGGEVLSPKQIRDLTKHSGYKGYAAEDMTAADQKTEPKRSITLRRLKAAIEAELKRDISRYRQCALALHRHRKANPSTDRPTCAENVHLGVSLKYNHLVNDFAHLAYLDELLNRQGDLFEV